MFPLKDGTVDSDGNYITTHGCRTRRWTFVSNVRDDAHLEEQCRTNCVYLQNNCATGNIRKRFYCRRNDNIKTKTYNHNRNEALDESAYQTKKTCTFKMLFVPWRQITSASRQQSNRIMGKIFSRNEHNHEPIQSNKLINPLSNNISLQMFYFKALKATLSAVECIVKWSLASVC